MTNLPLGTLDLALATLSRQTWEHLGAAKALSVSFGEETITDLLTLDLKRLGLTTTMWKQTSKPKEANFGTDFEWWIGHDTIGWVRFAVQAKKLNVGSQQYNFTHMVHGSQQLDILENHARAVGARPLYCLYNYSAEVDPSRHWQCCQHPFQAQDLGCTVVPASTIRTLVRGEKNFDFVHSGTRTLPWRCLASCPRIRRCLWRQPTESSQESSHTPSLFDAYQDDNAYRAYYERLPAMLRSVRESEQIGDIDYDLYNLNVDYPVLPKRICILELSPAEIG